MSAFNDRTAVILRHSVDSLKRVYTSRTLIWIIISLGILLRLSQYLHNRSLWLDELAIANNILSCNLIDLFSPLENPVQYAPVGFLLTVKITTLLFGDGEYSLRLFPLFCGIASIPLFYMLSKEILKPYAVPMSVALFAITPSLIYYSSEVKQYSVDVLAVILAFLLFLRYENKGYTGRGVIIVSICGGIIVWFSHPIVFVLAGIGVTLLLLAVIENDGKRLRSLVVIFSVCLLSFIINYFTNTGYGIGDSSLKEFHNNFFAPLPVSLEGIKWYLRSILDLFDSKRSLHLTDPLVWTAVSLTGIVSLFMKDKKHAFFLVTPIFITFCASILHVYPFYDRFVIFIVPIILVLLISGLWEIVEVVSKKRSTMIFGIFLLFLLFFLPFYKDNNQLFRPVSFTAEEIKPVLEYIKENNKDDDVIYCYYGARGAYNYYFRRYGLEKIKYVRGVRARENPQYYLGDVRRLRGYKRVWVLYSHVYKGKEGNEMDIIVGELNTFGKEIGSFHSTGAGVILYDLSKE